MRVRVVVADEGEARFYDTDGRGAPLRLCGRITNPSARLHDRDLRSDRPGRVFDHAPPAAGRRGVVARHGTGGERRPRLQEARRFAQRIADELAQAQHDDRFDRVVLIAALPFFGALRLALRRALPAGLSAEVPKDLVHQGADAVRAHLPDEVFEPGTDEE